MTLLRLLADAFALVLLAVCKAFLFIEREARRAFGPGGTAR